MNEPILLQKIHDKIMHYFSENELATTSVVNYHEPLKLKEKVDLSIEAEGVHENHFLKLIDDYLQYSVRTGKVNFLNQLFSGFSLPGYVGELISAATNTSMYTYEVAPMATLIEDEVLKKMLHKVGFKAGGGTFVTGGSNANLVALYAARVSLQPHTQVDGVNADKEPLAFYISNEAHYSFEKAAMLLGLGRASIYKVATDSAGRMDVNALQKTIKHSIKQGKKPFFVGATAGSTVRGSYDPLNEIDEVCREHNLWFHVDAAWGGGALLSKKHRHLLQGCNNAHSFAWDAHKMMGLPLICSVILMQDKNHLLNINQMEGGDYLFHKDNNSPQQYDLGNFSLQCGRKVEALKLWFAWKYYGDNGFEQKINSIFTLAQYTANYIQQDEHFELVSDVISLNVCFRYLPLTSNDQDKLADKDIDVLNLKIRDALIKRGNYLVNYATINNRPIIRLIIVNFQLQTKHIDNFFDTIKKVVAQL